MKTLPIILAIVTPLLLAATRLESPRESGVQKNARMVRKPAAVVVLAPAPERVILTWPYPVTLPQPGLIFDIEHRVNLRSGSWEKVGETNKPPFVYVVTGNKSGFFRTVSRPWPITLAWDASTTPGVNYKLYRGAVSRQYTNSISVVNATSAMVLETNRNFFAATAVDGNGLESVFSNEALFTPPPIVPVTKLTITTAP